MKLIPTNKFTKQSAKIVKNNSALKSNLQDTLIKLANDPFDQSLFTHKLKGELAGRYAARLTFDLRIIFKFEKFNEEDCILLLGIRTHDVVY